MKVLVLGCGFVGTDLARRLVAGGHHVVGTTTTPEKVEALSVVCSEVQVLRGSDGEAVARASAGCDAIVVTAGPSAAHAMTVEERSATYHDVLVATAESVVSVPGDPHVVMMSSFSVYGDAADHLDEVAEDAPLTDSDDPSPACFQAAERVYLEGAAGRSTVLRCADIFGGDDPPLETKITMAHEMLGGTVPFGASPLFYRVHVLDVSRAIEHVLAGRHTGVFNLTHPGVPPANAELFDRVSAAQGYPPLEYRGEIAAPSRPISVARLVATGFELRHTPVAGE